MDKIVNDFMEVIDNVVTDKHQPLDADYARLIYNFVAQYELGMFGDTTLQEAIDNCFDKWCKIYKEL